MKKFTILLPVILCAVLLAAQTAASYITISATVSSDIISGDFGQVYVELEQGGDEPAYQVEVIPFFSDYFQVEGELKSERLDPGGRLGGPFDVSLKKSLLHGNYPFLSLVIYHDANMYPFSVVSPHTITYVNGRSSEIFGSMETVDIQEEGSGNIALKIRNMGSESRDVKVLLYLPRELKSETGERTISVGPKEEKEIKYRIESFGALPGSSYSILASLEYDAGSHYTSFANGMVSIVEKGGLLGIPYWVIAAILIVLAAIFVISQRGVIFGKKGSPEAS